MLLDFTVANFGPFKGEATLSMHKTKVSEHPGNVLTTSDPSGKLLSSALIFGPNGAGKSIFLKALLFLRRIVAEIDPSGISPEFYQPYRITTESRDLPVRMRIRMKIDGILYDYSIDYLAGIIVRESLHYYPKGRRVRVFIRTGPADFKVAKKRVARITTPGITYLAMAATSDPVCSRFHHVMTDDIIILGSDPDALVSHSCKYGSGNSERTAKIVKALETVDLCIDDLSYNGHTDEPTGAETFLRHDFEGDGIDVGGRTFPMCLESDGTKLIFGFLNPLIDAFEGGKVVVIDDLGSHLHPMITHWMVRQFADGSNPNGAQLVASTHDISLMDTDDLLRRDQIWFVNKDRMTGASELYCLSDFDGVRKDTDVMKAYIFGRYDAVPAVRHRGLI